MKQIAFILAVFLLFASGYAFAQKKVEGPISGVQPVMEDFLFAAETEVTNRMWKDFLSDLKKAGKTELYQRCLPDSNCWRTKLGYGEPYVKYYFRHPAYQEYPVVGVTHRQAKEYCHWLESTINERLPNDDSPYAAVTVRLPTAKEWENAARGNQGPNTIYPWGSKDVRQTDGKHKGQFQANFRRGRGDYMGVAGMLNDNADVTAPAHSYWPNDFGLYNMSGNVAEMLAEEGQHKGGSWQSSGFEIRIDAEDPLAGVTEASNQVGFRYFIEVVSFKPQPAKKTISLSAKEIEKMLATVIEDSLYAGVYEVTNELYDLFLEDLKQTDTARYRQFTPMQENWAELFDYPAQFDPAHDPNFQQKPVVNISHEAASEFCNWLTEQYNAMPKRKFNDVQFTLPNEQQWELAARGGLEQSPYPWGGPYLRNAKGCYLSNFSPVSEHIGDTTKQNLFSEEELIASYSADGHYDLATVDSYTPNDFGAYNFAGNAAEMLSEKGVTKGGSWRSSDYQLQITSKQEFYGPSPAVGFRIFMTINTWKLSEAN